MHVADLGIRGMDLAYRLLDGYETVLFLDAPRGEAPGTLSVIEPDRATLTSVARGPDMHAMTPVNVLALAHRLGDGRLPRVVVVGCEPQVCMTGDEPDVTVGLSEPVRRVVERSVPLVESLLSELLAGGTAS